MALDAMVLAPNTEWSFETGDKTQKGLGAAEKYFSGKRRTYAEYQRSGLEKSLGALEATPNEAAPASRLSAGSVELAALAGDVTKLQDDSALSTVALDVVLAVAVAVLFSKMAKTNYNQMRAEEVKT